MTIAGNKIEENQRNSGGQGGFKENLQTQAAKLSNHDECNVDFIDEIQGLSNPISDAARWFLTYRRKGLEPVLPLLRERFGLTTLQAIEAAKLAHGMRMWVAHD